MLCEGMEFGLEGSFWPCFVFSSSSLGNIYSPMGLIVPVSYSLVRPAGTLRSLPTFHPLSHRFHISPSPVSRIT